MMMICPQECGQYRKGIVIVGAVCNRDSGSYKQKVAATSSSYR